MSACRATGITLTARPCFASATRRRRFRRRCSRCCQAFPILPMTYSNVAANLTYAKLGPKDPTVNGSQVLPPTMLKTVGGVKIGFIGLTSDIVPRNVCAAFHGIQFFHRTNQLHEHRQHQRRQPSRRRGANRGGDERTGHSQEFLPSPKPSIPARWMCFSPRTRTRSFTIRSSPPAARWWSNPATPAISAR